MKYFWFIFVGISILFSAQTQAGNLSKLHVQGNKILDSDNKVVQLRGVCLPDPECFFARSDFDFKTFKKDKSLGLTIEFAKDTFNANIIRLPVSPDPFTEQSRDSSKGWFAQPSVYYHSFLKPAVDSCIKYGAYVILDLHFKDIPYSGKQLKDSVLKFWKFIMDSTDWKNSPNILFELYNEPMGIAFYNDTLRNPEKSGWDSAIFWSWRIWADTIAQPLVDSIRSWGSKNILIVGSPYWNEFVDNATTYPIKDSEQNIVYSAHVYPANFTKHAYSKLYDNLKSKYPLFVTEWGFQPVTDSDAPSRGTFSNWGCAFVKWLMNDPLINWTAFCFDYKNEPRMFDPSYWWKDLKGLKDKNGDDNFGILVYTLLQNNIFDLGNCLVVSDVIDEDSNPNSSGINIYPNPVNNQTTIEFDNPIDDYYSIKITDPKGIVEISIAEQKFISDGIQKIDFDSQRLTSGIYLISINSKNFRTTKKFIVTK